MAGEAVEVVPLPAADNRIDSRTAEYQLGHFIRGFVGGVPVLAQVELVGVIGGFVLEILRGTEIGRPRVAGAGIGVINTGPDFVREETATVFQILIGEIPGPGGRVIAIERSVGIDGVIQGRVAGNGKGIQLVERVANRDVGLGAV